MTSELCKPWNAGGCPWWYLKNSPILAWHATHNIYILTLYILYEIYVFFHRFTSPLVFMFLFLRWLRFGLYCLAYNEIMNYYDGLPEMCTDTRKLIAAEYSWHTSSNFMISCHATYKAINLRNNIHLNRIDLNQ